MNLPRMIVVVGTAAIACLLGAGCRHREEPMPAPRSDPAEPAAAPAAPAQVPVAGDPPAGVLRVYVWQCDDGRTYKVRNLSGENAIAIDLPGGTHRLATLPSASGARYGDGTTTFWSKGDEATLESASGARAGCRELRAQSLVEDARARGVRYRGMGNEPGWTVEIGPGSRVSWVTAYGQEKHEYPNASFSGDDATGSVYTASDAAGQFRVQVTPTACQDDMSGQAFDQRFLVSFGGRDYRGCGSRLQD